MAKPIRFENTGELPSHLRSAIHKAAAKQGVSLPSSSSKSPKKRPQATPHRSSKRQAAMAQINANLSPMKGPNIQLVDEGGKPLSKVANMAAIGVAKAYVDKSTSLRNQGTKLAKEQEKALDQAIKEKRLELTQGQLADRITRRKREHIENVMDVARYGLDTLGGFTQGAQRQVDKTADWASRIPKLPGGVAVPLVFLLILYVLVIPVNGQSRIVWLWDVIIGDAVIANVTSDSGKGGGGPGPFDYQQVMADSPQIPPSPVAVTGNPTDQPTEKFWTNNDMMEF